MKTVEIYTDGACRGNPGPGGYGAVLFYKEHRREIAGGFRHTTNNRMELLAVVRSLETLKFTCTVNLYTDSKYISDAVNKGWLNGWKSRGWKKSSREDIKNPDLWKLIDSLIQKHKVAFHWVKGHSDNEHNNRADELAVAASKETASLKIDDAFEDDGGLLF